MTVTIDKDQLFAKVMFAYGCVTTVVALYVYISFAVLDRPEVPDFLMRFGSAEIWIAIATTHFATFIATLDKGAGKLDPLWAPVLPLSKRSVLIGRTILVVVAGNILYWFLYFGLTLDTWAPWRAVAAMFLLSTTYTAIHWAFRPENIFTWPVLRVLRDPLGYLAQPLWEKLYGAGRRRPKGTKS